MTPNRVTVALEKYGSEVPSDKIAMLRSWLEDAKDESLDMFMAVPIKKKKTALLLSIFLGGWGVDRFYIGDKGMGVLKAVARIVTTALSFVPVFGLIVALAESVWKLADIFFVYKKVKLVNYNKLVNFLAYNKR